MRCMVLYAAIAIRNTYSHFCGLLQAAGLQPQDCCSTKKGFMNFLKLRAWSPYIVGGLIGVLSWFTFASVDRPLGITTAFEYSAALAVEATAPDAAEAEAEADAYFKEPEKTPKIDWEWMLVVAGMLFGALLYVVGYAAWKPLIEMGFDWGKLTLPEATSTSPWPWVLALAVILGVLVSMLRQHGRSPPRFG